MTIIIMMRKTDASAASTSSSSSSCSFDFSRLRFLPSGHFIFLNKYFFFLFVCFLFCHPPPHPHPFPLQGEFAYRHHCCSFSLLTPFSSHPSHLKTKTSVLVSSSPSPSGGKMFEVLDDEKNFGSVGVKVEEKVENPISLFALRDEKMVVYLFCSFLNKKGRIGRSRNNSSNESHSNPTTNAVLIKSNSSNSMMDEYNNYMPNNYIKIVHPAKEDCLFKQKHHRQWWQWNSSIRLISFFKNLSNNQKWMTFYFFFFSSHFFPSLLFTSAENLVESPRRRLIEGKTEEQLLKNFNVMDGLGMILIAVVCAIAVTVGAGGGGVFVPIMNLVMGFTIHQATALSQSLMAGGTLAGLLLNLRLRHPQADRPLIDMDLVLLMGPVQIAGAMAGVVINRMLPTYLILAMMVLVLAVTAYRTYHRGIDRLRKDRLTKKLQKNKKSIEVFCKDNRNNSVREMIPSSSFDEEGSRKKDLGGREVVPAAVIRAASEVLFDYRTGAVLNSSFHENEVVTDCFSSSFPSSSSVCITKKSVSAVSASAVAETEEEPGGEVRVDNNNAEDKEAEQQSTSCDPMISKREEKIDVDMSPLNKTSKRKCLHWQTVCYCHDEKKPHRSKSTILRQEMKTQYKIPYCGVLFWCIYGISTVFLFFCSIYMGSRMLYITLEKMAIEFSFVEGDIKYEFKGLFILLLQTFLAGVIAGIVGIGGGMVLGPLMLEKGILPQVVVAANTTLVLVTSSSAAVGFLIAGQAPWEFALILGGVCFFAALLGKFILDRLVQHYNLSSLLIFLLLLIIVVSMVSTLGASTAEGRDDEKRRKI